MEIGFSQEKLTTGKNLYLTGYDIDRKTTRIHDDSYYKVLVINVNQIKHCFVQFDLLCLGDVFVKLLKKIGAKNKANPKVWTSEQGGSLFLCQNLIMIREWKSIIKENKV